MNKKHVYIRRDGKPIECEIVKENIPSLFHLLPLVELRGVSERLNPINRIIVPMSAIHAVTKLE